MMKFSSNLNIVFISSIGSVYKKSSWIGTYSFMKEVLTKYCGNVINIEARQTFLMFLGKVFNKLLNIFFNKKFDHLHSVTISKNYSKKLNKELISKNFDIVFAPAASTEIAFLKINKPIVYWSDATVKSMTDYYDSFSNFIKISKKSGEIVEIKTIQNSTVSVFSSEWAANSAIKDYNIEPRKVKVISYGANIKNIPSEDSISAKKNNEKCKILFLGVDWERKGGPIVYEAVKELKKLGMNVELIVCGCVPPKEVQFEDMIVFPYLNKQINEEEKKLNELLLTSNFLFVPTRAECSGIVFCEASAFGLPVISTDTGGVSGIVKNGINGYLLSYDSKGKDYAKLIFEVFNNKNRYHELILSSRNKFDEDLNWDSWGKSMNKIFNEIFSKNIS